MVKLKNQLKKYKKPLESSKKTHEPGHETGITS
jgi:hypothetical protein